MFHRFGSRNQKLQRTNLWRLIVVLSSVFVAPFLAAQEELTPDEQDRVEELLYALDDPTLTLSVRREVENELISFGPRVLQLFESLESPSGVRSLQRVRTELENEVGRAVASASKISIDSSDTLSEAFSAIESQTGNVFEGIDRLETPIGFTVTDVEYWPTMDRLLDIGQMEPSRFLLRSRLPGLVKRKEGVFDRVGRADYQGAFRIEAQRVESLVDLIDPALNRLTVRCEVAWEPRLRPITMYLNLSTVKMVDDVGEEIPRSPHTERLTARIQSGLPRTDFVIPFELPNKDARSIAELGGTVECLLLGPEAEFEFACDDEELSEPIRKMDAEVALQEVIRDEDGHSIQIRVRFDEASEAFESHQDWIFKNEALLVDGSGVVHKPIAFETTDQQANSVGLLFFFDSRIDLSSARFLYRTPTSIVPHRIEFHLKDIALP